MKELKVQCRLCPKQCLIESGQSGDCRVRINVDGVLRTVVYGYPCSIHIDPIEKKPFYHFLPGTKALSLATVGCNLHCLNCQNWEISQANPEQSEAVFCPPAKLVELAKEYQCASIAYTYTDPIVYYEYTYDTAKLAREAGLRSVLVTAGYANPQPWKELLKVVDAATIDLKGITEEFYRNICSATLKPIQDNLVQTKASGAELEVSNLIIPTLNDKPEEIRQLVQWVRMNLGSDTPLHFLGFVPRYKMRHLPPTSAETLDTARQIALAEGMQYVYIGNIMSPVGQNTYCPGCNKLLIKRSGYTLLSSRVKNGCCPDCGKALYGVWK
jgi:pyruvate formate lyase activating enzyme